MSDGEASAVKDEPMQIEGQKVDKDAVNDTEKDKVSEKAWTERIECIEGLEID